VCRSYWQCARLPKNCQLVQPMKQHNKHPEVPSKLCPSITIPLGLAASAVPGRTSKGYTSKFQAYGWIHGSNASSTPRCQASYAPASPLRWGQRQWLTRTLKQVQQMAGSIAATQQAPQDAMHAVPQRYHSAEASRQCFTRTHEQVQTNGWLHCSNAASTSKCQASCAPASPFRWG
jgi:hypothetical protein